MTVSIRKAQLPNALHADIDSIRYVPGRMERGCNGDESAEIERDCDKHYCVIDELGAISFHRAEADAHRILSLAAGGASAGGGSAQCKRYDKSKSRPPGPEPARGRGGPSGVIRLIEQDRISANAHRTNGQRTVAPGKSRMRAPSVTGLACTCTTPQNDEGQPDQEPDRDIEHERPKQDHGHGLIRCFSASIKFTNTRRWSISF